MKIRAAVLEDAGLPQPYADSRPLSIEEIDLDAPGEGEVLVQIKAAGLCQSDLSAINGARPRPTPMVLGHEAAGIVAELGPRVNGIEVGDHVVLVYVASCGHCPRCAEGRPALCELATESNVAGTLRGGARRLHRGDTPLYHHSGVAAFAEFATVSRDSVVKIDSSIPLGEAALFGCAVLTGMGAVVNTAKVRPGDTVAVVGLGGVGCNAVLGARASGARRLIAVDINPEKLALAETLGATDVFNARDNDCVERIRSATGGGVDYAFETAGVVQALDLAYRITRRGGTTVTAGMPSAQSIFQISHLSIAAEERTLKGSYMGSCVPSRDIPGFIDLHRQGRLPVDRLMSERLELKEINLGFDRLAQGSTVRQVVML